MGAPGAGFQAGASISGVSPNRLLQGRSAEVQIQGFATRWTVGATPLVSFGHGVTVKRTLTPSDTGLIVEVEVEANAVPGRRNVTVSSGGEQLIYSAGFTVVQPYELQVYPDEVHRPSISLIEVERTSKEVALPTPSMVRALAPAGLKVWPLAVEGERIRLALGTELGAPLGTHEVAIEFFPGTPEQWVTVVLVTVVEQELMPLVEGETPGRVPPYGSSTGVFVADGLSQVTLSAQSPEGVSPDLYVLAETGAFAGQVADPASPTFFASAGEVYYVIAFDRSGEEVHYHLGISVLPTSSTVAEAEPNNSSSAAQLLPGLPCTLNANLSSATDVDWFRVTLPSSAVGKVVRVHRTSGSADVAVQVLASDAASSLGTSGNLYYAPTFTSSPVQASGVHYLRFFASTSYTGSYSVQISLQ